MRTKKQNLKSALRDDLMRVGFMHQVQGDLETAAEYYIRSIERRPTAEAHTFLGGVLRQLGEIDQAISECKQALKLDPDYGNALSDLGTYFIEKGQYKKALPLLKRACRTKQHGSRAVPFFNLARLYTHQGMLRAAIQSLEDALKADPSFSPASEILKDLSKQLN